MSEKIKMPRYERAFKAYKIVRDYIEGSIPPMIVNSTIYNPYDPFENLKRKLIEQLDEFFGEHGKQTNKENDHEDQGK